MPRYDFRCPMCQFVRLDVWVSSYRDATNTFDPKQLAPCERCGCVVLEKLPSAPNFTIAGFSAKNGYSKS